MHMALSVAAAIAAAAAPQAAAQQNLGNSQLINSVQRCQQVRDNAARLACFDQAAAALVAATTPGDITVIDRNQVRQVRRSLFGFSIPRLPFFSGSRDRDVAEEPKELTSTLASFRPMANGFFRFAVSEPASTWESTEPSGVFEPKSGSQVKIMRGALGSYWAEIANQPAVKVRRVR